MAEMKDIHTSPVISRALETHLDSLEGAIFNIQKCFVPAYPPKKENSECHIDASDKIRGASTAFQFLTNQLAEDSGLVPHNFMYHLLPNKSENCVEKMKQVQDKKHEIEEEESHKEKVIALKVQLAQEERQRSADLEAELQEKRQRSADLEAELQEERQRSADLEAELQEKRQRSADSEAELQEERQRSADLEAELQEKRQRSADLEADSRLIFQALQEERQRYSAFAAQSQLIFEALQEETQKSADLEAKLQEERQRSSASAAESQLIFETLQEERKRSADLEAELQEERQRSSPFEAESRLRSQSLQSYIDDNAYMRSPLDSLDNAILEDGTNGRPPRCCAETESGSTCLHFANELYGNNIFCFKHYEMYFIGCHPTSES